LKLGLETGYCSETTHGGFRRRRSWGAGVQQVTAARLLESKNTIPHYYLTIEARINKLMSLRAQLNEQLAASDGPKLSVNDFIIKATALVRLLVGDHAQRH
jgi:pyruvate/2-oxoglutarate dehydrogenase complex dihydrolipoamide acyltransferase (E2) component